MEGTMTEKTTKEKKGFWSKFITFLSMGGFMVIIVVIIVIAVLISIWNKYF